LLIKKLKVMKKTFLNLRKMGFVLVAATSMLAFSCGAGEEAETTEGEATEEPAEGTDEHAEVEEASCDEAQCDAAECDGGDSTDAAVEASCDGAEASCDNGSCDGGH
jgi:hypothetical protein